MKASEETLARTPGALGFVSWILRIQEFSSLALRRCAGSPQRGPESAKLEAEPLPEARGTAAPLLSSSKRGPKTCPGVKAEMNWRLHHLELESHWVGVASSGKLPFLWL